MKHETSNKPTDQLSHVETAVNRTVPFENELVPLNDRIANVILKVRTAALTLNFDLDLSTDKLNISEK